MPRTQKAAAKVTASKAASPAKKAPAKAAAKTVAKAPAKSAAKPATRVATKAAPAKPATRVATKAAPAKAAPKKAAPAKAVSKAPPPKAAKAVTKAAAKPAPAKAPARPAKVVLDKFQLEQKALLEAERADYLEKAAELKAEADSLALEHEPGDIQFDEEGGEGGTTNVDRELDLVLSAQARAAVDEIDRALAKLATGTYGLCERCGKEIPKPRLKALPYAALCVQCKSGGLSTR